MTKLEKKVKLHFKLPVLYNDNTKISDDDIVDVKKYFVSLYSGLTIDSPSEGFWNDNGLVYADTDGIFCFHKENGF